MTDVLIAGGGLAGSAAAIQLGRLGYSVELFERGQFPKEKPCGEGLMPAGVAALARLKLGVRLEGAPFVGIRYDWAGRIAKARFPASNAESVGQGFRRRILDQVVFDAAKMTPRVRVHTGMRVQAPLIENNRICGVVVEGEPIRGRLVIAADGAQSNLRHRLGVDVGVQRKRIGMRTHFRLAAGQLQSEWVDIYLGRGFELYVTPLCHGEIVVAVLAEADSLDGPIEKQFRMWCARVPRLAARLEGARQISDLQTTAPLSGSARRSVLPGCVLLGDAAGFSDPITGGGMTQALLAADLLAQFAAESRDVMNMRLEEFDRARNALLRDYRHLTNIMLWLAHHQSLAAVALRILAGQPQLFSHLLGVSGGTRRLFGGDLKLPMALPRRRESHSGQKYTGGAQYETDIC